MTVDDVCAWLSVSRHWVYDEVEAQRLPHVRLGRRSLRFHRNAIQAYLDERTRDHSRPRTPSPAAYVVGYEDLEPLE